MQIPRFLHIGGIVTSETASKMQPFSLRGYAFKTKEKNQKTERTLPDGLCHISIALLLESPLPNPRNLILDPLCDQITAHLLRLRLALPVGYSSHVLP